MKIRNANKFDIPKLVELINNFYNEAKIHLQDYGTLDLEYVNKLCLHIILGGGIAIVAEKNEGLVGIILALKNQNIFNPDKSVLNELMIYVEPNHRKTSACYKMLLKYNEIAQDMVDNKKITSYTITKTAHLDQLKFERFGYKKTEEVWVAGIKC